MLLLYPSSDTTIGNAQAVVQRQLIDDFLDVWEHKVTTAYYNCLTATSEATAQIAKKKFLTVLQKDLQPLLLRTGSRSRSISNNKHNGGGGSSGTTKQDDEGHFLLGSTFSVAECVAAPWIQRFYIVLPYVRGWDVHCDFWEKCDPIVGQWMEAVRTRPSVKTTKCPTEEMIAAAFRYYVSYVSPGTSSADF